MRLPKDFSSCVKRLSSSWGPWLFRLPNLTPLLACFLRGFSRISDSKNLHSPDFTASLQYKAGKNCYSSSSKVYPRYQAWSTSPSFGREHPRPWDWTHFKYPPGAVASAEYDLGGSGYSNGYSSPLLYRQGFADGGGQFFLSHLWFLTPSELFCEISHSKTHW